MIVACLEIIIVMQVKKNWNRELILDQIAEWEFKKIVHFVTTF